MVNNENENTNQDFTLFSGIQNSFNNFELNIEKINSKKPFRSSGNYSKNLVPVGATKNAFSNMTKEKTDWLFDLQLSS